MSSSFTSNAMKRVLMHNRIRNFFTDIGGTAAVEFVLILPVLVAMLFGAIEAGMMYRDYHRVDKGVRDATRYLNTFVGGSM